MAIPTAMTELEKAALGYLMRQDDDSRELYRSAAAAFADALEGREFLVGDSLTVADIVTTGVLFASELSNFVSDESSPVLQAYFARLSARPALVRAALGVEAIADRGVRDRHAGVPAASAMARGRG